jgi:hypothetical protein
MKEKWSTDKRGHECAGHVAFDTKGAESAPLVSNTTLEISGSLKANQREMNEGM